LIAIALLWLAFPAWFIGRVIVRYVTRPKPVAEQEILPVDLLLPLLKKGDDGGLKSSELALIERLLDAHLTGAVDDVSIQGRRRTLEAHLYQKDAFDQRKVLSLTRDLIAVSIENQEVERT
jgi:hypothetical protein